MNILGVEERVEDRVLKRMRRTGLDHLVERFEKEAAEHRALLRLEITMHVEVEVARDLRGPTRRVLGILVVFGQSVTRIDPELDQDLRDNVGSPIERQDAAERSASCEIAETASGSSRRLCATRRRRFEIQVVFAQNLVLAHELLQAAVALLEGLVVLLAHGRRLDVALRARFISA